LQATPVTPVNKVITVNGETVPEAEIRAEMGALRAYREASGQELTFDQRLALRDEAVDMLIERALLFQEARRLKLMPSAEEVTRLAEEIAPRAAGTDGCRAGVDLAEVEHEATRRLTFDRLIEYWCRNVKAPKLAELREYYNAHPQEFARPEQIHAAHIVKHSEGSDPEANHAALESIRERILAGEDFDAIARAESDCPEKGGDLGFFGRGVMVDEFDAVVFNAPLHQVTPVFETGFGHHLAIVHARRPEGPADLNEVSPTIATALHRGKQDREVGRRLEALRKSAKVQVPA
jgi:peptidyl-prolyl cis-trans isomerase C